VSGSHTTLAPHRSFCRSSQCEHPRCPLDRVMTVAAAGVRRSVAIKDRARAHAVISRGVLAVCGAAVPRSDRLQGGPVIPSTRLRDKSALHARRQQPRPEPPRLSVGRNNAPQRPETAFDAVLPFARERSDRSACAGRVSKEVHVLDAPARSVHVVPCVCGLSSLHPREWDCPEPRYRDTPSGEVIVSGVKLTDRTTSGHHRARATPQRQTRKRLNSAAPSATR
jgi:hypothetical protein